jgi:hypothetical protein
MPSGASEVIRKYNMDEILTPKDVNKFIQVLSELHKFLAKKENGTRSSILNIYVGDGLSVKGILNIAREEGNEVYVYPFEPKCTKNLKEKIAKIFDMKKKDFKVIAPLNHDENNEIYTFFHEIIGVPVFPYIMNFTTSKWLLTWLFAPYVPRTFYFPDESNALDFIDIIEKITTREKILYYFCKDEYDFDLQPELRYFICSVSKIEYYASEFYEKAQAISKVGGLLIEEFLASEKPPQIQLNKAFHFGKIITDKYIYAKIALKPFNQGAFYDEIRLESLEIPVDLPSTLSKLINPQLGQFYRYFFATIDFIIDQAIPRIIDINSVANTWVNYPYSNQVSLNKIFKEFLSIINQTSNESALAHQIENHQIMGPLYHLIQEFGPAFIHGDCIISLKTEKEYKIRDVIKGFMELIAKGKVKIESEDELTIPSS